jgi:hypothetical protein
MRRGATLGADLDHPLVFSRGRQHGLAFDHIDADRLLAVNIDSRLYRLDHVQRMPMVRRADENEVEILFLQHLPIIGIETRFLLRQLAGGDQFGGVPQHLTVDITQGNHIHGRDLDEPQQVRLPVPSTSDQADPFFDIGGIHESGIDLGQRERGSAPLKEVTAVHAFVLGRRRRQHKPRGEIDWRVTLKFRVYAVRGGV